MMPPLPEPPESSEIVLRRTTLERALSFLATFDQIPQTHPCIAALTAALRPIADLRGGTPPVRVSRYSLELHAPGGSREEPLLLLERSSNRELLGLQRGITRELRRRATPHMVGPGPMDGDTAPMERYDRPEFLDDLVDLQRVLWDLKPPRECTVKELLAWCRFELGRHDSAERVRERERERSAAIERLERRAVERRAVAADDGERGDG